MNSVLKTGLYAAGNLFGGNLFFKLKNRQQFRILAYHGVDPVQDPVANYDGFQVHPDRFREQLTCLSRHYSVVPFDLIIQCIQEDRYLPPDSVVLTFDDGYLNNLEIAAPILQEFRMPATFFVTTGFVTGTHVPWWYSLRYMIRETEADEFTLHGFTFRIRNDADRFAAIRRMEQILRLKNMNEVKEAMQHLRQQMKVDNLQVTYPFMKISQVKELVAHGFDVQPHTVSHVSLAHESWDRVEEEVDLSVMTLQEWTGRSPTCFAYPYGGFENLGGHVVRAVLNRKNIQAAVTTIEGFNDHHTNTLMYHRLNVTQNHSLPRFKALLSGMKGMRA